ncbi:hypothetical protein AMECASPLE_037343 [Ameca splendens]|uniref:Uncharacterized protein n=1 Tax=Ameca splendens TaxID=208324 RepID=A0ABV0XKX8_9TELE
MKHHSDSNRGGQSSNHASAGVTVDSHMGVEVSRQKNTVSGRGTMQHQGRQEGRVLRTTTRPVGQNDSQRPVPDLKAQGCDPLIHRSKPQHETAELGVNKQTHLPDPLCTSPLWFPQQDLGPLRDGLMPLIRAWPFRVP